MALKHIPQLVSNPSITLAPCFMHLILNVWAEGPVAMFI